MFTRETDRAADQFEHDEAISIVNSEKPGPSSSIDDFSRNHGSLHNLNFPELVTTRIPSVITPNIVTTTAAMPMTISNAIPSMNPSFILPALPIPWLPITTSHAYHLNLFPALYIPDLSRLFISPIESTPEISSPTLTPIESNMPDSTTPTASNCSSPSSTNPFKTKHDIRRMRNKEACRKYRQSKRTRIEERRQLLTDLQKRNQNLNEELQTLQAEIDKMKECLKIANE